MNLAYHYGARPDLDRERGRPQAHGVPHRVLPDLAWNPERWPHERSAEFRELWAEREFGPAYAPTSRTSSAKYTKYNGRRKPELLEPGTFSLVNYEEADRVAGRMAAPFGAGGSDLPAACPTAPADAFFELVLYPIKACASSTSFTSRRRRTACMPAKAAPAQTTSPRAPATCSRRMRICPPTYNHTLAGGKWNHMMDQTHIGYTDWQQPHTNVMPEVFEVATPAQPAAKAAVVRQPVRPRLRIPAGWHGFLEGDGYVSMEAVHFTRNTMPPLQAGDRLMIWAGHFQP